MRAGGVSHWFLLKLVFQFYIKYESLKRLIFKSSDILEKVADALFSQESKIQDIVCPVHKISFLEQIVQNTFRLYSIKIPALKQHGPCLDMPINQARSNDKKWGGTETTKKLEINSRTNFLGRVSMSGHKSVWIDKYIFEKQQPYHTVHVHNYVSQICYTMYM